jgi:hypothetical protein
VGTAVRGEGSLVEQKTGGQHDSQIEQGEQKAEQFLGTDQQGDQGQQAGQGQ